MTRETPNESNAFAGESVLGWLRERAGQAPVRINSARHGGLGVYIDVKGTGSSYMVGASAEVEYKAEADSALSYDVSPNAMLDWTLQIHKNRTVMEKLRGKNDMAADDALSALIEKIVRSDGRAEEVSVVRDAV